MKITLSLSAESRRRLADAVEERGVSVDQYVQELVELALGENISLTVTYATHTPVTFNLTPDFVHKVRAFKPDLVKAVRFFRASTNAELGMAKAAVEKLWKQDVPVEALLERLSEDIKRKVRSVPDKVVAVRILRGEGLNLKEAVAVHKQLVSP